LLRKLWNFLKLGFGKRIMIACVVVISVTFFRLSLHLMQPLMALFWGIVFLISAELFTSFFTLTFLFNLWIILTHKKAEIVPIPLEISRLANKIGVRIKELRIRQNFCNAYVKNGSLVLGKELMEKLNLQQCLAVVAHELGHIKERHNLIRFLVSIPILLSAYTWFELPPLICLIALFAYTYVMMIPINWWLEGRADKIAAKYVGKEYIKSALLTLADKKNLNEPSETHPPIMKRIKLIEK